MYSLADCVFLLNMICTIMYSDKYSAKDYTLKFYISSYNISYLSLVLNTFRTSQFEYEA